MEIGLVLPMGDSFVDGTTVRWTEMRDLAIRAEAIGFDTVWTADEKAEGLYHLQSADLGATWSAPRRVASVTAKHSDLATDGRRLLIAWETLEDDRGQIMTSLSEDGGTTWAAPKSVAPPWGGRPRSRYPFAPGPPL